MQTDWHPIVDADGRRGSVTSSPSDPSCLEVRLDDGRFLLVPRALVHEEADAYRFAHSFAGLLQAQTERVVIPVTEEQLQVSKRIVENERLRLTTSVSTREEPIDVTLMQEELIVERVPVGKVVETATAPRQDGETLVVPVYEEVLVVEKRLMLREEIHVTRVRREQRELQTVTVRREEVRVERLPSDKQS